MLAINSSRSLEWQQTKVTSSQTMVTWMGGQVWTQRAILAQSRLFSWTCRPSLFFVSAQFGDKRRWLRRRSCKKEQKQKHKEPLPLLLTVKKQLKKQKMKKPSTQQSEAKRATPFRRPRAFFFSLLLLRSQLQATACSCAGRPTKRSKATGGEALKKKKKKKRMLQKKKKKTPDDVRWSTGSSSRLFFS